MMRKLILLSQTDRSPFSDLFDDYIPHRDFNWDKADDETYVCYGGGTDVNPALYGEPRGFWTSLSDVERDIYESTIFRNLCGHIGGFIGICRGAQLLTVLNGGKLIQDVTGHAIMGLHPMLTMKGTIYVTSTHHQMMDPFDLNDDYYKIIGSALPSRSTHYMDGFNKKLEPPASEPEAIWYPTTKCLAVQGHPEYMGPNEPFPVWFREVIVDLMFKPNMSDQSGHTSETKETV